MLHGRLHVRLIFIAVRTATATITVFPAHEDVGRLLQFLTYAAMVGEEIPQLRMTLNISRVIHQRRIARQVVADLRVSIEESVEIYQFLTCDVRVSLCIRGSS